MEEITIKLNRKKLFIIFAGMLFFAFLCGRLIFTPDKFASIIFWNQTFIQIAGFIGLAFCITVVIYVLTRLIDKNVAVIMDSAGITDYTNATSIGFIPWEDVKNISANSNFVFVHVKDPEKYIKKARTAAARFFMKANLKYYTTPVALNKNAIDYDFKKLDDILRERHKMWNISHAELDTKL